MCNPAQELENAFSTVTGWVDQALSGLGKTLDAIAENPLPTIATIALTAVGVPPVVTSLVRTAMTGGSMEDMVINMAVAYVGSEIGAAAGDAAVPELGNISGYGGAGDLAFQPTATDAILKSIISNASAQGATAILQGKNLDEVFNSALTGAVGGLINTSLRTEFGLDPSKFGDRLISDATKAAVSSIFTGKDPGAAIGDALSKSAFGSLANAAASGLKSTFKDLQESSKEFETTQTEADGLRAEIGTESTRLSGLAEELNSTSIALNSRQTNLVEAQSLLKLASNAYNGSFVSYDEAAQNAFAQRMGYELVDDGEGGKAWAKNVKYERNAFYDETGSLSIRKVIFTPEGNFDFDAQIPTSFEYVNIGTEAQNIANQQAAYLNTNIPQFKTDVEKFNTNLSTFNTDKSALDTKVATYTGLVNDLFGEDGKGGLNKKIEDLLVARDGYLEDLDESVTSLKEAAGEEISGIAKGIADEAVSLLDANDRSSDEVATAFAGLGYTPSAAEIARFVGEGDDATLSELLGVHVDQNTVDMEEARAAFQGTGYTPTDEELKSFIGQRSETALGKDAAAFADPRVFDINEVKALAQAEGIDLSARDILNLQKRRLIGVGDEVTLRNQLGVEFDNQFVTKNEARQYFQDLGYEVSEDDLNQFVGQRDESGTLTNIQEYVTGQRELDAQEAGFPDYATQQQYGGDAETYKEYLAEQKLERYNRAAVEAGFPDYATQVKYAGNQDAYSTDLKSLQDAEQLSIAQGSGFDDYATYQQYEGDIYAYRADLQADKEKLASDLGFPSTTIYDLYSGDIERYRQDEADYAGFPDWKTYTEYAGDSKAYQDALAVADGWPDADTRDEFGTKERYAQHLRDLADEDERGRQWNLDQKAIREKIDAADLPPSTDSTGVSTTEGGTGTDLDGGEDTAKGAGSDEATGETKSGNIVITGADGSTVTLSPDGSVVDVTDAEGNKPSNVQDVVADVISNPANVDTLEGAAGNDTFVAEGDDSLSGGTGNDTLIGDGEDTPDGGVATTEGGAGNDTVTGAVGNDTFTADGDDSLGGETDEDILDKLFGDDTFIGGDGNDTFVGGEGADLGLREGKEEDLGDGDGLGEDKDITDIDFDEGGGGSDTLEGGEGNDTVTDVETLEGGDGNDSLDGDKEVEPEPTFTCPEGFTYDYELGACMPDVPVEDEPELPDDTVPTCPEGFIYDYELGACVPEVTEPPEPEVIECEEGYVYDPVQGICVPEVISPPEVIECEEGYVYDPVQKMCVPDVPEVIECEEGYVYDPVQGICVPETIVTPPVVNPPVVNPPQPPPPQQCPTGYVYDAKLKQCVPIKPDLPLGLTFDQFAKLFGSPTTQPAAQKPDMSPKFETFYANIPGYKPFDLRQFSSDFFDEE